MSGTDTIYQQLREHLHTLGLNAAADRLAPALEAAERDKPGYTEFLHEMLTAEVAALAQRRLAGPDQAQRPRQSQTTPNDRPEANPEHPAATRTPAHARNQ
ncbi:MAG: hypothetical protein ACYCPS_06835 [Candidatus Saccharimonadales bacterium]